MSLSNYDRHGLLNLRIEGAKVMDRWHIPPAYLYIIFFAGFLFFGFNADVARQQEIDNMKRRNMLKAIRKNQTEMEYDTDKEITPAEQVTMATS